jgi:hypothetical protein
VSSGVLDYKLAQLFINEGKFMEARVILRECLALEKPPSPGGMCGVLLWIIITRSKCWRFVKEIPRM